MDGLNRKPLLVKFIVVLCISMCSGQSYANMTQLWTDMFTGYNPEIIPLNNQSEPLKINITVQLYGIVDVDSLQGVLTLVAGVSCFWYDEQLQWNPADYGGITKIISSKKYIWTPVIALGTPIEFQQLAKSWTKVTVYSNGKTIFGPGDVLRSSCTMTVKYWPFDKQLCEVIFFPADYTTDLLEFVSTEPGFFNYNMLKNSEWTLEDYTYKVRPSLGSAQVLFVLKLQRQSMFYVLSIILPLTGLFLINTLVFVLPQESGERISYSITITLALAVFLTVVSNEMPKSSDPMSLMCIFILLGVVNSLLIMIIATLNMRWYYKTDETSPGAWLKVLVRISKGQFRNKVHDSQVLASKNIVHVKSHDTKGGHNMPDFMNSRETNEATENKEINWKDVTHAVDVIFFWVFFLFASFFCMFCNVYISLASDYDESLLLH